MKRPTAVIVVLLWLAFAVRVFSLASQSVWWDEAFTWQTTSHGWDTLWRMLQTGDRNPPLYFVLTTVWGGIAGWSEFSLRFVPLVCGLIGVAFLYALARRLFGRAAGVWTLLIGAVAPALVVYSQEARMYALFFALTAAMLYFGFSAFGIERDAGPGIGNQRSFRLFLLIETLLLLTHYFALPIVIAFNLLALVVWLRRRAKPRQVVQWFGGQLLAALPLLVWTLSIFATPGSLINARESPPDAASFLRQVGLLWLSGVRDLRSEDWLALIGALLLVLLTLIGAGRKNFAAARWLGMFGVFSLALAYTLTSVLTSFHPRYLLPYIIPWYVLAGGAVSGLPDDLQRLTTNRRSAALAGLTLGSATAILVIGTLGVGWQIAAQPSNAKDDARGVAAYLKANATADDVILVEANDYTLAYYDHGPAQTRMITATTESDAFTQLSQAIGQARRVWLPHWKVSTQDPRGYWPFLLEQSGELTDWRSFQGYEVYSYDLQQPLYQPVLHDHVLSFGTYEAKRSVVTSADTAVTMAVEWARVSTTGPVWTRASIRLSDEAGHPVSSVDSDLAEGVNYYRLPLPPGTPPTKHPITIRLYNQQQTSIEQIAGILVVPFRAETSDPYRTLSAYDWLVPSQSEFAAGLDLEALALSTRSPQPLALLDVTLRWRKTGDVEHVAPQARLVQNGHTWTLVGSDLFEHEYPIGQWADNEMVLDRRQLVYPPLRGPMELQIGQGDRWITLTTLQLDESQLLFNPPSMQRIQSATYGDFAELLGYDLESNSIASDRPLNLTLYWRAANIEPMDTAYTVFTQLIAPDGHLVAQHDAPPNPPTPAWVPEQIVTDTHALTVVDATYRGPATLIVGWYNSASVVRVPASTGGDSVTLNTLVEVIEK